MGWLWASSSPKQGSRPGDETRQDERADLVGEQRAHVERPNEQAQISSSSREELSDTELESFLNSWTASDSSDPGSSTADTAEKTKSNISTSARPSNHDRFLPDGSINIHPEAIYPITMSCRQAFDQAFYCQSLGGKFNDIYRYGHLKDCSEQWGAFWFCMRNRTLPAKDKEAQIREYYRARDERKTKEFGSSENIWELREKAVEKAFWKDPDVEEDGQGVQIRE